MYPCNDNLPKVKLDKAKFTRANAKNNDTIILIFFVFFFFAPANRLTLASFSSQHRI